MFSFPYAAHVRAAQSNLLLHRLNTARLLLAVFDMSVWSDWTCLKQPSYLCKNTSCEREEHKDLFCPCPDLLCPPPDLHSRFSCRGSGVLPGHHLTTNLSFFCCEAATEVNSWRKQEAGHRDVAVPKNSVLDVSCACGCLSGTIWTRTAEDSWSGRFIWATVEHLRMWGVPYICDVWFLLIHKHKICI